MVGVVYGRQQQGGQRRAQVGALAVAADPADGAQLGLADGAGHPVLGEAQLQAAATDGPAHGAPREPIELPPRFAGRVPPHQQHQGLLQGLAQTQIGPVEDLGRPCSRPLALLKRHKLHLGREEALAHGLVTRHGTARQVSVHAESGLLLDQLAHLQPAVAVALQLLAHQPVEQGTEGARGLAAQPLQLPAQLGRGPEAEGLGQIDEL